MTLEPEPKKRRERSPSYPALPLRTAVDKVRELYKQEKGFATPIETILRHWGYTPGSGSGAVAIAAVLKFGLIEDEGSGSNRRARVSDLGQRIVRDAREDSPDRDRLIRQAALMPAIHQELWQKYGGSLPSDSNLQYTLKFEYGFTDVGAREFLREFRSTIAYAGLGGTEEDEPDSTSVYPTAIESQESFGAPRVTQGPPPAVLKTATTPSAAILLTIPIASSMDRWPTLTLPDQLTEAEWNSMLAVLAAMSVGLVKQDVRAEAEVATGSGEAHDAVIKTETTG